MGSPLASLNPASDAAAAPATAPLVSTPQPCFPDKMGGGRGPERDPGRITCDQACRSYLDRAVRTEEGWGLLMRRLEHDRMDEPTRTQKGAL